MVKYVDTEKEISDAIKKQRDTNGRALIDVRQDAIILLEETTYKPKIVWLKEDN